MISLILSLLMIHFTNATVIDLEDNLVVIETEDGNIWDFEGDGYQIGDEITVRFDTNGTEDVTDDEIVRVYASR